MSEQKPSPQAAAFPCSRYAQDVPGLLAALEKLYPAAECGLHFEGDPWRLLVMAILSAQCTDKRVNQVAEALFARFPTPQSIVDSAEGELEEYVRSCGLYRMKAKNIRAACEMLCRDYGGAVPSGMDDLLRLPGVGRKIANLMLGDVFDQPAIVTDTHCIRLSGRFGFTPGVTDPLKVERALSAVIPQAEQAAFCHRLVRLGRDFCTARAPKCDVCPLRGSYVGDAS